MSREFNLYERVRVVSDRFAVDGTPKGTLGCIIDRYEDGAYEIEVSNADTGETVAQFVATSDELESAPEA